MAKFPCSERGRISALLLVPTISSLFTSFLHQVFVVVGKGWGRGAGGWGWGVAGCLVVRVAWGWGWVFSLERVGGGSVWGGVGVQGLVVCVELGGWVFVG